VKLSQDAELQLITRISSPASLGRVQTLVKTKLVLELNGFLIANNYAVHGHI